jgi:hypothetical protein
LNYLAKAALARRIAPRQTQRANAEHSSTTTRKAAA